jgi:hypothetical protein
MGALLVTGETVASCSAYNLHYVHLHERYRLGWLFARNQERWPEPVGNTCWLRTFGYGHVYKAAKHYESVPDTSPTDKYVCQLSAFLSRAIVVTKALFEGTEQSMLAH